MAGKTGFTFNGVDFNDIYVRSEYFTNGGLWLWGYNAYGQIGDNTVVAKSSPVQTIAGGTNWKMIGGTNYSLAVIKNDGSLWTWGLNTDGQLGDSTNVRKSSPIQTVAGGQNWKLVSYSGYHVPTIKTDGTLWIWGRNNIGQLGDNTTTKKSSPIQTVAGGANWKLASGGKYHTATIKTDGTLWTWGSSLYGQLGDNTGVNKSSPVQTVASGTNWKFVTSGFYHIAAIKTDGTLWTWGRNDFNGQLGDNTAINKSSPVQTIAGGTNWKMVSCGGYHTAAIKTDGTLWTWGRNSDGPLGDNSVTPRSSPVQTVAGGSNWKLVTCAAYHTAAIKTDGTLWTWGRNAQGQLGDGTNVRKSSPVQTVAGGTNWKILSGAASAIRDQW